MSFEAFNFIVEIKAHTIISSEHSIIWVGDMEKGKSGRGGASKMEDSILSAYSLD